MGIKKDAKLRGDDYQWLSSMFYFGGFITVAAQKQRLIFARLPGMGISHQPSPATSPSGQILLFLYHNVGHYPILYGSSPKLFRCIGRPFLPRCF